MKNHNPREFVLYGAGQVLNRFLPSLKHEFDVRYILDKSKDKQGCLIDGCPVLEPRRETINDYDIIITINDIIEAYESITSLGYNRKARFVTGDVDCFTLTVFSAPKTIDAFISHIKHTGERYPLRLIDYPGICLNADVYNARERRIFSLASFDNYTAAGGACACLRNINEANGRFSLVPNLFTICPTVSYIPSGYAINQYDERLIDKSAFLDKFSEELSGEAFSAASVRVYFFLNYACNFIMKIYNLYHFSNKDIFLLHEPYIAYVFTRLFPDIYDVVHSYHQQGSLSSELDLKGVRTRVYDYVQEEALKRIKHMIFPSRGALDGFKRTSLPGVALLVDTKGKTVYNGYTPKEDVLPDESFKTFLNSLKGYDLIFASATYLYKNKGVERIPGVISLLKKATGLKIHWVLIGGGEKEDAVSQEIRLNLENCDYTWFRARFDNQDNVFALFKEADFYIMLHKISIFDLSVLQAMGYGCVPFLSDVGGNKELCGFNNGILYDGASLDDALRVITDKNLMRELKEKNKRVVKDVFNDYNFLNGYAEILLS